MNFYSARNKIDGIVEDVISDMSQIKATDIGLDIRSGYRLWVSTDAVAVENYSDGSLQYYGGFEYVDKEFRVPMGDYVFYLAEDSRVQDCIDRFYQNEEV